MLRIQIIFTILFIISAMKSSMAQEAKVFNAKSSMLKNGMQVVVVENPRIPVITHMVWYKVGAADEPRGKSGIAHFLEHLMFKGSGDLEPGEFSRSIKKLGGTDNAFTSQDYTAYFQSIASEHLETVMQMEADRMQDIALPDDEVKSERSVILEERAQRTDNSPQNLLQESLNAALFVNHPYGAPVIGWRHEMEGLNKDDARDFHEKWYAPNNAILVVSGDVKADDVFKSARKIYGAIEPRDIPARNRTLSPPYRGPQKLQLHDKKIRQPVLYRPYRVASYNQNKDDALALQVLEDIFGANSTSYLYKSLVIDKKLATSAGLSYRASSINDSSLWLYATPAPGIEISALESAIDEEISKFIDTGVSDTEVLESVQRLQDQAIFARDSLTGPAMVIGYSLITGSTLDDVETWPAQISNVNAADVQRVAQKYLDPQSPNSRFVTGYLLPQITPITANKELEPESNDNAEEPVQ